MAEAKSNIVDNAQFRTATLTVTKESIEEVEQLMKSGEHAPNRNAFLVRIPLSRVSEFVPILDQRGYVHQGFQKNQKMHVFYRWFNADLPCGIPQLYTARLGVTAAVVDKDNKICLITELNPDGTKRFKGKLKWVSGAVGELEDIHTAAVREMEEEIGVPQSAVLSLTLMGGYMQAGDEARDVSSDRMDVVVVRLRGSVKMEDGDYVYRQHEESTKLVFDPSEVGGMTWMTPDQLRAMEPATLLNPEWRDQLLTILENKRLPELELKLDAKRRRVDILPCA